MVGGPSPPDPDWYRHLSVSGSAGAVWNPFVSAPRDTPRDGLVRQVVHGANMSATRYRFEADRTECGWWVGLAHRTQSGIGTSQSTVPMELCGMRLQPRLSMCPATAWSGRWCTGPTCRPLATDCEGGAFPLHSHQQEQITYVVRGHLTFEIDGLSHRVFPGDVVVIPSGVAHAAIAGPGGADVVSFVSPARTASDGIVMIPDAGAN